jgi:amylosucrase
VAGTVRIRFDRLIAARRALPSLHAAVATTVRAGRGAGVAIFERRHPAGDMVQVYNVSDVSRWVGADELACFTGNVVDHVTGKSFDVADGFSLAPYAALWLTAGE